MSEKYRCANAFVHGERVYAGGMEVAGDDPILRTHNAHFVAVDRDPIAVPLPPPSVEDATAAPGERRELSTPKRRVRSRKASAGGESDADELSAATEENPDA